MDFVIGGLAAMGAGVFTNPLEVVKTRMQLQGELKARGLYTVHYKNFFHAFYAVAKADGIRGLQKGLVPALWFQLWLNGTRLGTYQLAERHGLNLDRNQHVSPIKSVLVGAMAGCIGAYAGSPFYLVKTHLQSQAATEVAVGHQHHHGSMASAFKRIYHQHGLAGLWRGSMGAMPRTAVGSSTQLVTFSLSKEHLSQYQVFGGRPILKTLVASMISGVVISTTMAPFDVVLTRLYNQGVDAEGKGLLYRGVLDCFVKMWKSEGFWGFYKGFLPLYARLGPHTVLCFVFMEELKELHRWIQDRATHS